jgi:hypothetical protein
MDIPALIARIADVLGGVIEVCHAVKLSEEAMNSFEGSAHVDVRFEIEDKGGEAAQASALGTWRSA